MTSPLVRGEAESVWRDSLWLVMTPHERLVDAVRQIADRNYEDGYCWCGEGWPEEWRHSESCSRIRDALRGEGE